MSHDYNEYIRADPSHTQNKNLFKRPNQASHHKDFNLRYPIHLYPNPFAESKETWCSRVSSRRDGNSALYPVHTPY